MTDTAYWPSLAADYLTAYGQTFPSAGGIASEPSHRNALVLAMSVAQHETQNSLAWPGSWNFGAVQLRSLTAAELAAFHAGALKQGDFLPDHSGVLHVDTHPIDGGGLVPYPVWFAAFPTRVAGIEHFLRVLWADSDAVADQDGCDSETLALHMYLHGYFEEFPHGKGPTRPVRRRSVPLWPEEQARVDDYGVSVEKCRAMIEPQLAGWDYGLPENLEPADPANANTPRDTDPSPPEAA